MSASKLENIDVLAELERIRWKWEPAGDNEIRTKCPVHEDRDPSCSVNTATRVFKCHVPSCYAHGDIISFLAYALKVERSVMIIDLSKRYDLEDIKVINPATVEKFHADIFNSGPLLQKLRDRSITDDMIREARLGFYNGRITIPIYDQHANVVNIRRYLPGAPAHEKMKNTPGYGKPPRLYQIEQMFKYDIIWVVGGEMKALVAKAYLNPLGIGVVTPAAGEGSWNAEWNSLFKGKKVFVCMDVDLAGKVATRRICTILRPHALEVRVAKLPLDTSKFPKGDINDWVHAGATTDDFQKVMLDSYIFEPSKSVVPSAESEASVHTTLSKASHPSMMGKRLIFDGVVSAQDTTPFLVPKRVGALCDRKQSGCPECAVYGMDQNPDTGFTELTVPATALALLSMVDAPTLKQPDALREALGIPRCKSVTFTPKSFYKVTDLRLVPQLTIGGESSNNVVQQALVVDSDVELNTPYNFSGVIHPHPNNQQATLLIDEAVETDDNLSTFAPDSDELKALLQFRPKAWTVKGIEEKLDEVYSDLESNVTRIFGRREIHLLLDLAYHSVLVMKFDDKLMTGWTNVLLIGDSSQGKSETSMRLMEHYGLGERVVLKNATVAGLIGGLQQLGTRWFVSWGVIPTHDRRLVILEEVKGADTDVLGKLTDMRSSGIAEIPKIERRRAHARTRLVFISNPRSNRAMAAYNFGIEAIQELIGGLEDVRRFDAAIVVSAGQVSVDLINKAVRERSTVPHQFTNELSRRLVLYAWTRTQDQVQFEPDAMEAIFNLANALCSKFTEGLPLVDRGTMRHKLARLAVALAVRTFSANEDNPDIVVVRKCHVEYIYEFLDTTYSAPQFGYLDYSKAQVQANVVLEPKVVEAQLMSTQHPKDFISQMLYRDEIMLGDIQDWCEVDMDQGRKILSFLIRKHCLFRTDRAYYKTADFISLLKVLEQRDDVPEDNNPEASEDF